MEKKNKKQFRAIAKYIAYSPYKLRPIVDVVRGKKADYALNWLSVYKNRRTVPIYKVIKSAVANAGALENMSGVTISEIKVDQGPIRKYFRPGAQGRAQVLRTRYSHISVIVESKEEV